MSYDEFSQSSTMVIVLYFVINLILTWAVGLIFPLLLRYLIIRKKVYKTTAIVLSTINFIFMIIVFRLFFESQNKTYFIEFIIAYVTYRILVDKSLKKIVPSNDNIDDRLDIATTKDEKPDKNGILLDIKGVEIKKPIERHTNKMCDKKAVIDSCGEKTYKYANKNINIKKIIVQ